MQLTHLQAWEKIRAAFQDFKRASAFDYESMRLDSAGLCGAVSMLNMNGEISYHLYSHMLAEIKSIAPPKHAFGYYWLCDSAGAKERVKAIDTILGRIKAVVTHLEKQTVQSDWPDAYHTP